MARARIRSQPRRFGSLVNRIDPSDEGARGSPLATPSTCFFYLQRLVISNITEDPHSATLTMTLLFPKTYRTLSLLIPPVVLGPNSCIWEAWVYMQTHFPTNLPPPTVPYYITSTHHLIPFPNCFTVLVNTEVPPLRTSSSYTVFFSFFLGVLLYHILGNTLAVERDKNK